MGAAGGREVAGRRIDAGPELRCSRVVMTVSALHRFSTADRSRTACRLIFFGSPLSLYRAFAHWRRERSQDDGSTLPTPLFPCRFLVSALFSSSYDCGPKSFSMLSGLRVVT